jgi:preprotein translocase subunit SecD
MMRTLIPLLLIAAAPAETLTIGGVAFPQSDFVDARAIFDETGAPAIYITLSPAAATKLAAITHDNLGKPLSMMVGGRLLTQPVVREPILGGTMQITGLTSAAEARRFAKAMSGKDPLPESFDE